VVGAGAFFGIGHLTGKDLSKFGRTHAARQNPGALNLGRGGDDKNRIAQRVSAGFKQQRDIQKNDIGTRMIVKEPGAIGGGQRVNDRVQPVQDGGSSAIMARSRARSTSPSAPIAKG